MTQPQKHIVFDVVGTLVSFTNFHAKIASTIGDKLLSHNITPQFFGHAWMTDAELEFTFLSISTRYKPYKEVMKAVFYRTLHFAGVKDPRGLVTEEERQECLDGYSELGLRDGAEECLEILKQGGFSVWAFTSGDIKRVKGYFDRAGIEAPEIVSCDGTGVAKPDLNAYKPVLDRFGPGEEKWFAAAHHWDVSAAVKCGFQGAFCTEYEGEGLWDIFGEDMDVVAETLPEMARRVVEKSNSLSK